MICRVPLKLGGILSAASWLAPELAAPNNLSSRRFPLFPWETSMQLPRGWPCATGKHLGLEARQNTRLSTEEHGAR